MNQIKAPKIISLLIGFTTLFLAALSAATTLDDVDHKEITIMSQGVRLAGDIYTPKNLRTEQKLPGILLIPGRGGSKENLKINQAPQFADLGFVVLAFDYKSWGKSDGPIVPSEALAHEGETTRLDVNVTHVRNVVDPFSMLSDVRAALHYLGGEPQVMPNNLGIWGTSFGGALAVVMAANDDRVQALVDQMGPVNFPYNQKKLPVVVARKIETAMARGDVAPFPNAITGKTPGLKGYSDWAAMKRFNSLTYADQLKMPTLIIDAENETVFDRNKNGVLLHEAIKGRVEAKYVTYPGGHYDLYTGDNQKAALKEASDWFVKYLK